MSDSFIIYSNNVETDTLSDLIDIIRKICHREFIDNGILIRGAIAKGEFDAPEAKELSSLRKGLIVGQAYVDAYLLEDKGAKTVGILLSDEVYRDVDCIRWTERNVGKIDEENVERGDIACIMNGYNAGINTSYEIIYGLFG